MQEAVGAKTMVALITAKNTFVGHGRGDGFQLIATKNLTTWEAEGQRLWSR